MKGWENNLHELCVVCSYHEEQSTQLGIVIGKGLHNEHVVKSY